MAQYTDLFTRKAYFELLEHQEIDKPARDAYWKLLHRCHIPVVKKLSYQHPVFTLQISLYHFEQECLTPSKQFSDAQESATVLALCKFPHNHSAPGIHTDMELSRDCPINIRTATHSIIGLGILKTLAMFPIDFSPIPPKCHLHRLPSTVSTIHQKSG